MLGAGDLDGDGADEILVRDGNHGQWFYYDVDGGRATPRHDFGATRNLAYAFAGIGDLDGDGRDDILARHEKNGNWIAYLMNGTARAVLVRPRITPNPLFTLRALADLNGDGRADPLLRHVRTGQWIQYVTGNRAGRHVAMRLRRGLGMPRDASWTFAAIGDYDGDGRATPMLRRFDGGDWRLYHIEGTSSEVVHYPALTSEPSWAAVETLPWGNPATLARVEFLQGPPVFRRDYRTGETVGPITGGRPENGAAPLQLEGMEPWLDTGWREANRGFVTALWRRWLAVAVAADHPYPRPLPEQGARILPPGGDAIALEAVHAATEPAADAPGHRTETVFLVPRELNVPETVVEVTTRSAAGERVETLPLFGEAVEALELRWIPIWSGHADVPAVDDLGEEGYTEALVAHMPVADYRATVEPEMRYRPTGDEPDGFEFDPYAMWAQLWEHQAEHGCGPGELYIGIYNSYGLDEAGLMKYTYSLGGDGAVLDGGPRYGTADYPADGYGDVLAHEFGHGMGLGHPACPDDPEPGIPEERYPYEDGRLGAARGWHHLDRSFVERDKPVSFGYGRGEVYDIMTYCHSKFVSDFTYQHVLTVLQAPFYKKRMEDTRACMAERANPSTSHRTLAIVGEVGADGTVTVLSMRESDQPAWPEPTAGSLPPGARLWTMELLDGTGGVVHRHGIRVPDHADAPPADPRRDDVPRLWSHRIPYPAGVEAVLVRDHSGDVRTIAGLDERLSAL